MASRLGYVVSLTFVALVARLTTEWLLLVTVAHVLVMLEKAFRTLARFATFHAGMGRRCHSVGGRAVARCAVGLRLRDVANACLLAGHWRCLYVSGSAENAQDGSCGLCVTIRALCAQPCVSILRYGTVAMYLPSA